MQMILRGQTPGSSTSTRVGFPKSIFLQNSHENLMRQEDAIQTTEFPLCRYEIEAVHQCEPRAYA